MSNKIIFKNKRANSKDKKTTNKLNNILIMLLEEKYHKVFNLSQKPKLGVII